MNKIGKKLITILVISAVLICTGCAKSPVVTFPSGQNVIKERTVYLQSSNDVDGFQMTLITELSRLGIKVIDDSYGGIQRTISVSPDETLSYQEAPSRVGLSYTYEPLYGWGPALTMSFQGKVTDYHTGTLLMLYSIERGSINQQVTNTAKSFAIEIFKLFDDSGTAK